MRIELIEMNTAQRQKLARRLPWKKASKRWIHHCRQQRVIDVFGLLFDSEIGKQMKAIPTGKKIAGVVTPKRRHIVFYI